MSVGVHLNEALGNAGLHAGLALPSLRTVAVRIVELFAVQFRGNAIDCDGAGTGEKTEDRLTHPPSPDGVNNAGVLLNRARFTLSTALFGRPGTWQPTIEEHQGAQSLDFSPT